MRTGITNLPLHGGKAPAWLFDRMRRLARGIVQVIISEFDSKTLLEKLSDPYWFQALGCVLGFDWHSSGLTTTTCGALKEGIKGIEQEMGFFVAGGKGGTSRKTPEELDTWCQKIGSDSQPLIYASKMSAKVDSTALQDGYQLYHHVFFFTKDGQWSVIQQGMNDENRYARRYHWLSDEVTDFVCEPHHAICCDKKETVLDMVSRQSTEARSNTTALSKEKPEKLIKEIEKISRLTLPERHPILLEDINSRYLHKILLSTYEKQPENFEQMIGIKGVGPKTVRSLALMSELIYGSKPSFEDPVRYSFAHGGKDGFPYPVDRKNYDTSVSFLNDCLKKTKEGYTEKQKAFKRLYDFYKKNTD